MYGQCYANPVLNLIMPKSYTHTVSKLQKKVFTSLPTCLCAVNCIFHYLYCKQNNSFLKSKPLLIVLKSEIHTIIHEGPTVNDKWR